MDSISTPSPCLGGFHARSCTLHSSGPSVYQVLGRICSTCLAALPLAFAKMHQIHTIAASPFSVSLAVPRIRPPASPPPSHDELHTLPSSRCTDWWLTGESGTIQSFAASQHDNTALRLTALKHTAWRLRALRRPGCGGQTPGSEGRHRVPLVVPAVVFTQTHVFPPAAGCNESEKACARVKFEKESLR